MSSRQWTDDDIFLLINLYEEKDFCGMLTTSYTGIVTRKRVRLKKSRQNLIVMLMRYKERYITYVIRYVY